MWLTWLLVMLSTIAFLKWLYMIKVLLISLLMCAYILVHELTADIPINDFYKQLSHNLSSTNGTLRHTSRQVRTNCHVSSLCAGTHVLTRAHSLYFTGCTQVFSCMRDWSMQSSCYLLRCYLSITPELCVIQITFDRYATKCSQSKD